MLSEPDGDGHRGWYRPLMSNRLRYTAAAGVLAILAYVSLAAVSYASYPTRFGPLDNWLSDLGNPDLNPAGAFLYRLDAIVVGVLLALFFLGVPSLVLLQKNRGRLFIALARGFGLVAACALIMTGVFSEGAHASHSLWSNVLYSSFGTSVFMAGWAFLYLPYLPRRLSYFAFSVTAATWVMSALNKTYVLEWILVALMLLFVAAVSYRMLVVSLSSMTNSPDG